jgi:hypothetical protein
MIVVFCRLLGERRSVLSILQNEGAIWLPSAKRVVVNDVINVNPSGRVYYKIDDTASPMTVVRLDSCPIGPHITASDFIKVHEAKKKTAVDPSFNPSWKPVYPFELVGDPVELEKGSNKWYRQVSTAKDVVIPGVVEAKWRGANTSFPLMAILSKRQKPYIGFPNGSTPGPLFVRVPAPEKVVKMTKAELQKLVVEKFGANAVLQIAE